ncbi:hypothetical protein CQA89_26835 [Klebsiella pneumoniae]|nr:hypothetical protein CQA89_26835 [Klebsiella pneumoniae]
MTVAITDVVLRDAHQSLFATRLRLDDMLPVAAQLDDVGYRSLECWGGATFDACIRFLGEDPWVRLRRAEKGDAEDPAADAAPRPEPARLPPLRRRRGGALRGARRQKRHGRLPRLRCHERPAQHAGRPAGGPPSRRPRPGYAFVHHQPGAHPADLARPHRTTAGDRRRLHRYQGHVRHPHPACRL